MNVFLNSVNLLADLNGEEVIKLTRERLEAGKDAVAAVFLAKKGVGVK